MSFGVKVYGNQVGDRVLRLAPRFCKTKFVTSTLRLATAKSEMRAPDFAGRIPDIMRLLSLGDSDAGSYDASRSWLRLQPGKRLLTSLLSNHRWYPFTDEIND